MGDEPTLDLAALERLTEWGGTELSSKMIDLFLQHAPERADNIKKGLNEGDRELAHRSAHSLKSTAANVGAEALRAVSGRIEALADAGDTAQAADLLPELDLRVAEALAALEEARKRDSA